MLEPRKMRVPDCKHRPPCSQMSLTIRTMKRSSLKWAHKHGKSTLSSASCGSNIWAENSSTKKNTWRALKGSPKNLAASALPVQSRQHIHGFVRYGPLLPCDHRKHTQHGHRRIDLGVPMNMPSSRQAIQGIVRCMEGCLVGSFWS